MYLRITVALKRKSCFAIVPSDHKQKRKKLIFTMKKVFTAIALTVFIITIAYKVSAYIPESEQILQTTATLNRHLNAVQTIAKTTIFDDRYDGGAVEITEQSYIKTGGFFRSERYFPHGTDIVIQTDRKAVVKAASVMEINERVIETAFPLIYFHTSVTSLLDDLNFLGIDTRIVSLGRADKAVAFVIGSPDETIPGSQLWIDKKRGFPVRFVGISTSGGQQIRLRAEYRDYKKVNKRFWFPTKIEYYRDDRLLSVTVIQETSVNKRIPESLFEEAKGMGSYSPLMNFITVKE